MSHRQQPIVVAIGLVEHGANDDGPTYLVTLRRKDDVLGGLWELPGGKVETGETPQAALVREFREELGVELTPPTPLTFAYHDYPTHAVLLLVFAAQTTACSPTPRALASDDLKCVGIRELLVLPMPAANGALLRRVADLLAQTPGLSLHRFRH